VRRSSSEKRSVYPSLFLATLPKHSPADCPQNTGPLPPGGSAASGSNAAPTGPRSWGASRDTNSWRDRDDSRVPDVHQRDPSRGKYDAEQHRRREDGRDRHMRSDFRGQDRRDGRPRRSSRSRSRSKSPRARRKWHDGNGVQKERRRSRSVEDDYRDKRRRLD
jgi:hypothetical protein